MFFNIFQKRNSTLSRFTSTPPPPPPLSPSCSRKYYFLSLGKSLSPGAIQFGAPKRNPFSGPSLAAKFDYRRFLREKRNVSQQFSLVYSNRQESTFVSRALSIYANVKQHYIVDEVLIHSKVGLPGIEILFFKICFFGHVA